MGIRNKSQQVLNRFSTADELSLKQMCGRRDTHPYDSGLVLCPQKTKSQGEIMAALGVAGELPAAFFENERTGGKK